MTLKRTLTMAVAAAAMTGLTMIPAAPAMAASGDSGLVLAGSNIRTWASTTHPIAYTTRYNAWISLQCYRDTQSLADNGAWRRWFKFYGQDRWVWADNVRYQPSLPRC